MNTPSHLNFDEKCLVKQAQVHHATDASQYKPSGNPNEPWNENFHHSTRVRLFPSIKDIYAEAWLCSQSL